MADHANRATVNDIQAIRRRVELLDTDHYGPIDGPAWQKAFHVVIREGLIAFLDSDESICWWTDADRVPISTELLHIFSLPNSDSVQRFKETIARHINRCWQCACNYYRAQRQLRIKYMRRYTTDNVDRFLHLLRRWDEERVVAALTAGSTAKTDSRHIPLREALSIKSMLEHEAIRSALAKYLRVHSSLRLASDQLVPTPSGLFCLLGSSVPHVRSWAMQMAVSSVSYSKEQGWPGQSLRSILDAYRNAVTYIAHAQASSEPYASFTSRFWRFTYQLVNSLPQESEEEFCRQHGSFILQHLANSVRSGPTATGHDDGHGRWVNDVISLNQFAKRYIETLTQCMAPDLVCGTITAILAHSDCLLQGPTTPEPGQNVGGTSLAGLSFTDDFDDDEDGNDDGSPDSERRVKRGMRISKHIIALVESSLGWVTAYAQHQMQPSSDLTALSHIYQCIREAAFGISQDGLSGQCATQCLYATLNGITTYCSQRSSSGDHTAHARMITFLDRQLESLASTDRDPAAELLCSVLKRMIQEGLTWLDTLQQGDDLLAADRRENDWRKAGCALVVWSSIRQLKAPSAICTALRAGMKVVYLQWRLSARPSTGRLSYIDSDEEVSLSLTAKTVIDTLYSCLKRLVDTIKRSGRSSQVSSELLVHVRVLCLLDCGTANSDRWTLLLNALCGRVSSQPVERVIDKAFVQARTSTVDAILIESLRAFNRCRRKLSATMGAHYMRLLSILLRSYLADDRATPANTLMTQWASIWEALDNATWLDDRRGGLQAGQSIRRRILSIIGWLLRWQTTDYADACVACLQLQPCIVKMADWCRREYGIADDHQSQSVPWQRQLVGWLLKTTRFVVTHVRLDAPAVEAIDQLLCDTRFTAKYMEREEVQTLQQLLVQPSSAPTIDFDWSDSDLDSGVEDDGHRKHPRSPSTVLSPIVVDLTGQSLPASAGKVGQVTRPPSALPASHHAVQRLQIPKGKVEIVIPLRRDTTIQPVVTRRDTRLDGPFNTEDIYAAPASHQERVNLHSKRPATSQSLVQKRPRNDAIEAYRERQTSSNGYSSMHGRPTIRESPWGQISPRTTLATTTKTTINRSPPNARTLDAAWSSLDRARSSAQSDSRVVTVKARTNRQFMPGHQSTTSTGPTSLVRQMRNDMARERAPIRNAIIQQQKQQQQQQFKLPSMPFSIHHRAAPLPHKPLRPASKPTNGSSVNATISSSGSDDSDDSDGFAEIMRDEAVRFPTAQSPERQRRTVQLIDLPRTTASASVSLPYVGNRPTAPPPPPARQPQVRRVHLNDLHQVLLQWRPNQMEQPPDSLTRHCRRIPDTYSSINDYLDALQPVLTLECWQQVSGAMELVGTSSVLVVNAINKSRQAMDGFHEANFEVTSTTGSLLENDLVLLVEDPAGSLSMNRDILRSNPPLGLVRSAFNGRTVQSVQLRLCISNDAMTLSALHPESTWRLIRLSNMTTLQREFDVLGRLARYPLCDNIIRPRQREPAQYSERQLQQTADKYNINPSQAKAVLESQALTQGLLLIQGPPGTGKTNTILAIIAALRERQRSAVDGANGRRPFLVCAPSNAAIDEIVSRLCHRPDFADFRVVRLGNPDSVHGRVKDVSLDSLIDAEMDRYCSWQRDRHTRDNTVSAAAYAIQNTGGSDERMRFGTGTSTWPAPVGWDTLSTDHQRRSLRKLLIQRADVVCTTLSASGHDLLRSTLVTFETVIIDEASQCVELSTLIPLQYKCQRCILVGDPNQLPPTVLSPRAIELNYARSLFERVQNAQPTSVNLLTVQYRMHPLISQFPSRLFYRGQIKNGPTVEKDTTAVWHSDPYFGPFVFYNAIDGRETNLGHSYYNTDEVTAALMLVYELCQRFPKQNFAQRIGIITPYKSQLRKLKQYFTHEFGRRVLDSIDFNTVDGFQGQEKDIIIFSAVRASHDQGVGFLSDTRRMNVALTRARCSLFVIGHATTMERDRNWRMLTTEASQRRCMYNCDALPWLKLSGKLQSPRNLLNHV